MSYLLPPTLLLRILYIYYLVFFNPETKVIAYITLFFLVTPQDIQFEPNTYQG